MEYKPQEQATLTYPRSLCAQKGVGHKLGPQCGLSIVINIAIVLPMLLYRIMTRPRSPPRE
jgi:hypothetical protein